MLPVTDRFLAALRQTHQVSVAAAVYAPSDLATAIPVAVLGGQLTIDRDARIRRHATLDIAFTLEDTATRTLVRELPFGGYCTIERGIRYADGTIERVQLGRLRVDSIVWHELQGEASLTLNDRMAQIQDEALTAPYAPSGMHPTDAIVDLVDQVFGDAIAYHVLTDPSSEPTLGIASVYLDDRAGAITDLASSINAIVVFDNLGDLVVRPTASSSPPAWTIDAGEHGSMIGADETLDRSSVRNGVVVRGQADPDQPAFYSLATYDDPAAPTRWGGPFGKVALISDSTTVTTQDQADSTAASLLNLRLGLQRTISLTALPNPALEPDDVIQLEFADGRSEQQIVNSTQIGLDPTGPLTLTTSSSIGSDALPSLAPTRAGTWLYRGGAALAELADARLVAT